MVRAILRCALCVLPALALLPDRARASPAAGPDSLRLHVEVGGSTDYTNELFYEDTYDSTAITGRHLVDSPETRYAGVLFARLNGTRGRRTTGFELQNELSLGDLLSRDAFDFSLHTEPSPRWTFYVTPEGEYRRDRTFGRNLEEWRGSVGARARRALDEDDATFLELAGRGDVLSASGAGSEYILDRRVGSAEAAFERAPLFGPEWRLDYTFFHRIFTDSTDRNSNEHDVQAEMRIDGPGGRPLVIEAGANRRTTLAPALTTRDNFWEERGAFDGETGIAGPWTLRARVEGQAVQYDAPDSVLYFDYQELTARVMPKLTRGTTSLSLGPRVDVLFAAMNPEEAYQEIAAMGEYELLALGAWWNVVPIVGWRDYDEPPAEQGIGLHSSYTFYEIDLLADQALPGSLRLRAYVDARLESHVDHTQDARSLYFSLDLRRLF